MKDLKNAGIKVYVIPGNHDVNNPDACSYVGDSAVSVPNITPQDFQQIYSDCGYSEAIYKDPNSLAYIVEPVNGVWLFAMDACRYAENTTSPITGGKFSTASLNWILSKLAEAKSKNKFVLGMMHHGILEHYAGQKTLFSDYIVDDYQNVGNLFSSNGMRYVFTGHYHAQDVTRGVFAGGNDLYDIETGSLVTYPSPVRIVKVSPDLNLNITSSFIQTINYNTNGKTFPQYAKDYLIGGMTDLAYTMLTAPVQYGGFGVADSIAKPLSPIIALAFTAHYAGDEKPDAATLATIQSFLSSPDAQTKMLGQAIGSLWTDIPPADNNLSISASTVPVELYSFIANIKSGKVLLKWNTATETNNKGFNVERKLNNTDWSSVGFVKGNGTTSEKREYSFTDKPGVPGTISYRLKQTDFDGSFDYSDIQTVENNIQPTGFLLEQNFPNPFNPSTVISFSLPVKSNIKLKVLNILGKEVATLKDGVCEAGNYNVTFDASNLSSGIYFYSLITNNGIITKKMTLIK